MSRTLPQFFVGLATGGCAGAVLILGDVFPTPAPLLAPLPAAVISVGLVLFGLSASLKLPRRRPDNSASSNTQLAGASLGNHEPATAAGSATPTESSSPSLADASPTIVESSPGPSLDASSALEEPSSSPDLDDSPPLDEASHIAEETPDDHPSEDAVKPAPADDSGDLSQVSDTRETPPGGLDTAAETSRGLHEEDTRDADDRSYSVMQALSAQKHSDSNNEDTSS